MVQAHGANPIIVGLVVAVLKLKSMTLITILPSKESTLRAGLRGIARVHGHRACMMYCRFIPPASGTVGPALWPPRILIKFLGIIGGHHRVDAKADPDHMTYPRQTQHRLGKQRRCPRVPMGQYTFVAGNRRLGHRLGHL